MRRHQHWHLHCSSSNGGSLDAGARAGAAQRQQAAAARVQDFKAPNGYNTNQKKKPLITRAEYASAELSSCLMGMFTTDSEPKKFFKNPYCRTLRCRKLLATRLPPLPTCSCRASFAACCACVRGVKTGPLWNSRKQRATSNQFTNLVAIFLYFQRRCLRSRSIFCFSQQCPVTATPGLQNPSPTFSRLRQPHHSLRF